MSQFMTAKEAADYLRISKTGIYRLAAAKKITSARFGDRVLFLKMWLDQYVEENTVRSEGAEE